MSRAPVRTPGRRVRIRTVFSLVRLDPAGRAEGRVEVTGA